MASVVVIPDNDEFVGFYNPDAIDQRQPTWSEETSNGRWRCDELEDRLVRDTISLDLVWLKDGSLLDSNNLIEPDGSAAEIAENLRSVLQPMEEILRDLEISGVVEACSATTTRNCRFLPAPAAVAQVSSEDGSVIEQLAAGNSTPLGP